MRSPLRVIDTHAHIPPVLLEQIDEAAVVQLYADGFEGLPLTQKVLIWHLYQAALAGRDIYFDQRYGRALEMREVLEEILVHATVGHGAAADVLAEIRRYTKLFWINCGPHNNLTARKFVLKCTREQFRAVAQAAQRGRTFSSRARRSTRPGTAGRPFFDPRGRLGDQQDARRRPRRFRDERDNLYESVGMADGLV
jgi:hypothetical protein